MKFRPILFSTPMVQAILNGTKKQTRRIVKPHPNFDTAWKNKGGFELPDIDVSGDLLGLSIADNSGLKGVGCCVPNVKVKAHKDDIFWVRETFCEAGNFASDQFVNSEVIAFKTQEAFFYEDNTPYWGLTRKKLDTEYWNWDKLKWKPSIFMPKDVCRIFLKITNVRVERLQDISEEESVLEGIENFWQDDSKTVNAYRNYLATKKELEKDSWAHVAEDAIDSFKSLWQSINGVDNWYENPYVWVYEFELIEKPEGFSD
jgi:hypothetical protein